MTSKTSSSTSPEPYKPPRVTYSELLRDSDKWAQTLALFQGSAWRALKELMEAERQEHLEALVYAETPEERDSHLIIVRWLMEFFDSAGRESELRGEHQSRQVVDQPGYSTGSDWMAPDSGTIDPEGNVS